MLEVYRRDRRRLLGFLLSAGGGGGRALDLSRVDLDAVSADYALECVSTGKSGRNPLRARGRALATCVLSFDRWGALGSISHLMVRVLINPGAQFNASEATRRYFDEKRYPIMVCVL